MDATTLWSPRYLYIIATMNSSDRSIGHIDVAIRRRFGLYHVGPNPEVVRNSWKEAGDMTFGGQLAELMQQLNKALGGGDDPTAEVELGVGDSYFLPNAGATGEAAKRQVQMKWVYQVQPLLRVCPPSESGADFFQTIPSMLSTEHLVSPDLKTTSGSTNHLLSVPQFVCTHTWVKQCPLSDATTSRTSSAMGCYYNAAPPGFCQRRAPTRPPDIGPSRGERFLPLDSQADTQVAARVTDRLRIHFLT